MNIIILASFNLMKLMVCWNWVEYHQLYFDEIFRLEKVLIVQPQQPQRKDLMLKCYKYHSRGSPVWIKYEILQFNTTFFLECWAKFENILCSFLFSDMGTMLEYESTGNKYYFFHVHEVKLILEKPDLDLVCWCCCWCLAVIMFSANLFS